MFLLVRPFVVGRELDCDIRIDDARISRKHVEVLIEDGRWIVRDCQSGNGVFVNGRRIERVAVDRALTITLGPDGPSVAFEVEAPVVPASTRPAGGETMVFIDRYVNAIDDNEPVGQRTMMIRRAIQKVQKKQRRRYGWIVAVVAALAVTAVGYALYSRRQVAKQTLIAEDLFYSIKSLDVEIANLEKLVVPTANAPNIDQVKRYYERRRELEANYERFISGLNPYGHSLSPQEQQILRVTRMLGECEMAAPPEYVAEVLSYIRRWQGTNRFANGIARAQTQGYTPRIVEALRKQNLPPQFFYLALQESDFNEVASGPSTRFGYAKGMWQFIPDTAKQYGLKVGPLAGYPRPDPADDRHHWEKATDAAARYIKDIYSTRAQASGLLVMASYNWGERRVVDLIDTLPENPRERNFWKLLARYNEKIPDQTYKYVLNIVSAAVIGENPRLFGFNLDNPLALADGAPVQSF